jgi:hypothetical protein
LPRSIFEQRSSAVRSIPACIIGVGVLYGVPGGPFPL